MPRLWYCDHYDILLPPGHKFPMAKYRLLREALAADCRFTFAASPFATREQISLVHHAAYVEAFLTGALDPKVIRRIGFPWSENLVHRTLASVGGTIQAARDALESGWGGNLAGGTHHAFPAEGAGFCVFNDIAVAIRFLQSSGRLQRAAVIDLDVHQGDGTAVIFERDADVLTVSLHGRDNFPFRKQSSGIDVALADGTSDCEYLEALTGVLPQALQFRPEIVFYQSGVDALETDRLGRLALTHKGLQQRDELVFGACANAGVPCVVTLGGGYSEPVEATVRAHENTFVCAANILQTTYSK